MEKQIKEVIEILKNHEDFGRYQTLEVTKNRVTGSFFGCLDTVYLDDLLSADDVSTYTATVKDEYEGEGMEGGYVRIIRIVDQDGHGFETLQNITEKEYQK